MHEAIAPGLLLRWQSFYVIVGSSAAALTGLQFVVVALVTQMRIRNSSSGIDAFSTPTIVYFGTVLLLASVLCAPWNGLLGAAAFIALCGAAGMLYAGIVIRRAVGQTAYRMVPEDWVWHVAFPLAAHVMLLAAGLTLTGHPVGALFTTAAAALLLLVVGIHNAWDTVTYMVIQSLHVPPPDGERQEPPPAA